MKPDNYLHSISKDGYTGYAVQDEDPIDPRTWDNLGTMICSNHSRYALGDKNYEDAVKPDTHIILPLYLYDHGAIELSTTPYQCPWDSGQIGIIAVSKKKAKKEFEWKRLTKERINKVKSCLEGEVDVYNAYIMGDTYGLIIKDDRNEVVETTWGFYGNNWDENGFNQCFNGFIHHNRYLKLRHRIKQIKSYIRHKVPLIYRKPFKF